MHALSLDQVIEVGPYVFVCISFEIKMHNLVSLGHHALKCAIGGPRIKDHTLLSHKHDKGCGCAHICLKCIAMLCFALCCCQKQILQEALAGRPSPMPTGHPSVADSLISGR